MALSFGRTKKHNSSSKKIAVFLLVFLIVGSFLAAPLKPAKAQIPVTDMIANAWNAGKTIWDKLQASLKVLWDKVGSIAFQQTLRTALNKIAYDTANYIGSGGAGQKPLFVTQDWGAYLAQIGDEAAGEFVEKFVNTLNTATLSSKEGKTVCDHRYQSCADSCYGGVCQEGDDQKCSDCLGECDTTKNSCYALATATSSKAVETSTLGTGLTSPSFNVCQPSSIEAKIRIGLGLVEEQRPQGPNCTASEMIQNWTSEAQRLADYQDPNFLDKFKNIFDPASNDLGIYMLARTDMSSKAIVDTETSKTTLIASNGWLDARNIAGDLIGVPDQTKQAAASAQSSQEANFGKVTGDILVDSANIFLNQLAMSAFKNVMQNLGKQATGAAKAGGELLSNPLADTSILYGESNLQETTAVLLKPNFGVKTDYNILSQLALCLDPNNPGPANCVIDDKLMQGITEKRTVAEALKDGYLHGDWQLSPANQANTYSSRNIAIMIKYRILPLGWQVAVDRAYADPTNPKKVTLQDLVSCFDPHDQYTAFSANFNVRDQGWCQGLLDPNWVLKAPLNYCASQGVGAQILSQTLIPGTPAQAGFAGTLSTLSLTRAEDYCGNEQTCIKEKADGSCEAYGYCNEEQRIWTFGDESCDPLYNTCQTFTKTAGGQTLSYLQNTLDYGGCNADNAGCRQYSWLGAYDAADASVAWDAARSLYLNKNAAACSSAAEGCSELLRIKPAWGANLVMDGDLAHDAIGDFTTGPLLNDYWPIWTSGALKEGRIVDASSDPGGKTGKALKVQAETNGVVQTFAAGIFSTSTAAVSTLPRNLQVLAGQAYTLSADVYLSRGEKVRLSLGSDQQVYKDLSAADVWQHLSVTRAAAENLNDLSFSLVDSGTAARLLFYVKNIKLEMSNWDTGFSPYGANPVYEKLLPPYLETACYQDAASATKNYRLKDDAPAACSAYARKCNQDEVGCELYTASEDGFSLPAKVTPDDYCPAECLGYDIYIAKATYFNLPQAESLIPAQARTCAAQAVGCNEFTNLDQASQGGEQKEYYSYLKQCIQPVASLCANFYTWEGTENGYQLKTYNLQNDAGAPKVTDPVRDANLCSAAIYNLPITSPDYNPDCYQFYNSVGQISYHLLSLTVTCSDDCHPYRLTAKNIDKNQPQNQCTGATKHWDGDTGVCYVCQNGGTWDNGQNACVYNAIPGEGKTCKAGGNGCREFNGPSGATTRLAAAYDFEDGLEGWFTNCPSGISWRPVANDQNGHSLLYNSAAINCQPVGNEATSSPGNISRLPLIKGLLAADNPAAQVKVADLVSAGSGYNLKFLAQAGQPANLQIYFLNPDTNEMASFTALAPVALKGGGEWALYQASLADLDHAVGAKELLVITADHDFYLDDVILNEITDRYYLLANSAVLPDICSYDIFDNYQGTDFNLGCSQYTDRGGLKHNLRQFGSLCSSASVGCEQMVSTQNYSLYSAGIWKDLDSNGLCDANEPDCVKVAADTALYAVFDAAKQCNSADLGCSRLGEKTAAGAWSDVFKENNPNLYDRTLCGQDALGCEEWKTSAGTFSYFKDPGNNACLYRSSQDPTVSGKAWYKVPAKRCDADASGKIEGTEQSGPVCANDAACDGQKCIIDNNDYPCSVSYFKTIGLGGAGNQVPTPDAAAGLCDANNAGCSEYIDPVSRFSPNLVYNPGYSGADHEGWGTAGETWNGQALAAGQQIINLQANKLYIFSTQSASSTNNGDVYLDFKGGVKPLLSDNTFGTTTLSLHIATGLDKHIFFDSLSNTKALLKGGAGSKTISVKEAAVNYQLAANVDKKSCNGLVKFDNGCVLFDERSVGSSGLASLAGGWDAYATVDGQAPVACGQTADASCTANELIKVRPDRICAQWLDCVTYIQDPQTNKRTCYAVGECDRLNDKNECADFVTTPATPRQFDVFTDNNATGYSLLNDYYFDQMTEVGLNSDGHYDFEDSVPALSCKKETGGPCSFNTNIVNDSLVREPAGAPTDYPAHGRSYLKVPAGFLISPQSENSYLSLVSGSDYFLNLLVNTKNSGLGAKLIVQKEGGDDLLATTTAANSGWERKIFKFSTPTSSGSVNVKIYLGTDSQNNEQGYAYFDDINIEPVLETGNDQYAARECRLFPASDSLTCVNKDNNVISDGWEGYCLLHDGANPANCLLWYPVDRISSAKTGQPSLGYSSKYPLNYCTEANGDFQLQEKRVINKFWDGGKTEDPFAGFNSWDCSQNLLGTGIKTSGDCRCGQNSGFCPPEYIVVDARECHHNRCNHRAYCVPNKKYLGNIIEQKTLVAGENTNCVINYYEGWGEYNGLAYRPYSTNCDNIAQGKPCEDLNEAQNADPPVRVYNYDSPPVDEDGLKLISGLEPDKIFRLTCNQFTQVVDSAGLNFAWTGRVSINSAYPTSTPPYFVWLLEFYGQDSYDLVLYGRNREDIPFGAAVWPDDFNLLNSEPIPLRNQYSKKNNETIFAGRPYGCANGSQGSGCDHIGYCSLDPSVYCLYSGTTSPAYDINKQSCGSGGYGQCLPLWNSGFYPKDHGDDTADYKNILKTIFLRSYGSYAYSFSDRAYSQEGATYDYANPTTISSCQTRPVASYNNFPNSVDSFCAVYPRISNLTLKFNDKALGPAGAFNKFNINARGIYRLEFNTLVDSEQQPLREIRINWDDGEPVQVITGQDHHPSPSNPHVFYHYYRQPGTYSIFITIFDNWGFYGSCLEGRAGGGLCLPPIL